MDRERFRSWLAARLVAFVFLAAFAASVITLIYTGLSVRGREDAADTQAESAAGGEAAALDEAASRSRQRRADRDGAANPASERQ